MQNDGVQTLGPDVNESNLKFTVNRNGNIRFGLGAVKGVGEAAVQSIMEERRQNGPFLGIFDFVQRVNLNACNKKNMECLALAGGFDSFPELKREQYFAVNSKGEVFLETLMRYGNRYQADKAAAVNSLFGGENVIDVATPEIPQGVERWSDLDRLNRERDLVGIYLSAHPLDEFSIVLEHVCNTRMADLEDKAALVGREITMGGIVTSVRRGVSKNGNPYGIAKIEDYSGSTEIPFWGNDWVTYQGYLNEGTFLYIKARCQAKQWRQDELEVKITSMELLPDVKEELVQKITIIPRTSGALGYTMQVDEGEHYLMTKTEMENKIATLTGGRAAEKLIFHEITTGASNDIEQATKLARAMITRYGMTCDFDMVAMEVQTNQYLGGDSSLTCSTETQTKIDEKVVEVVRSEHEKAAGILMENREKLDDLARYLYEKETITGEEFMNILNA